MGRSFATALVGSIVGVAVAVWVSGFMAARPDYMPRGDAWPAVLHAQRDNSSALADGGLSRLVALAEELYWLRRAEAEGESNFAMLQRQVNRFSRTEVDEEAKALRFLIDRVTVSLGNELDRWQREIHRLDGLHPAEREAALRLLAFAKWQQKGGAYEYAYDLFRQLSEPVERPRVVSTATPVPSETATPKPTLKPTLKRRNTPRAPTATPSPW